MKKTCLFALLSTISSCGQHAYHPPSVNETDKQLEAYYKAESRVNLTPSITFPAEFKWQNTSRGPASVAMVKVENVDLTNRQLYFSTLLDQRNQFLAIAGETSQFPKSCPHFHSMMVKYESFKKKYSPIKNFTPNSKTVISQEGKVTRAAWEKFPELSLPVEFGSNYPRVGDILENKGVKNYDEVMNTALKLHIKKAYDEISELCEYGKSENYFLFSNLVTYKDKFKTLWRSSKGFEALMKSPIYANWALLSSLSKSNQQSFPNVGKNNFFEEEIHQRLETDWLKQYFQDVGKVSQR